ncbi:MAG TPA: toll/interleukin-1 receptor domain-containing protein [Gemmataceae bacterium]|nr:toll/interleukin-1 receptor domain-containing protein [Gemmataceae bacterium]
MSAPTPSSRPPLFLSYGHSDATELALRLRADLDAAGYDVWLDRQRIRTGQPWGEQAIRDGLDGARRLAAADPHNAGWQRDLSVSLIKLGNVRDEIRRQAQPALPSSDNSEVEARSPTAGPGDESVPCPPPPPAESFPPVTDKPHDENVQFTVYRPQAVAPGQWYSLLAFAHLTAKRPDAGPSLFHPP